MDNKKFERLWAGIDSWKENFGEGKERRGADDLSWYDISINANSLPCEKELCILVTAWHGQLKWLKAILTQYRLSDAFVILSFDNPFYPFAGGQFAEMQRMMPNPAHYILANSVVHKHITGDSNKRNGWFWDVRYAQGIIKQFPNIKYVYCTNGDCIIEKPEGFKDVIDLLGDSDLMAGQSDDSVVHTADVIYKVEAFHKIYDAMYEIMRVPVIGSRSPEGMLRDIITDLGIKVKHAPKQPIAPEDGSVDYYSRFDQDCTWKELLGYKNLFAIQETCGNEGREPLDPKYFDFYMDGIYFSGEERETIVQFLKTGDRRYLWMWMDRWEDSDYNRIYTDVNYYSKKPVYNKEDDAKFYHTTIRR